MPLDHFSHSHSIYFSRASASSQATAQPILSAATLRKLTKLVGLVGKSSSNDEWWGAALDDSASVERIVALLRRGIEQGVGAGDLWAAGGSADATPSKGKGKGKGKGKAGKGKATPSKTEDEGVKAEDLASDADALVRLEKALEVALESVLATDCFLVILTGRSVPKQVSLSLPSPALSALMVSHRSQLYLEETISLCLAVLRDHLVDLVYPFIDAISDPSSGHGRLFLRPPPL